MKNLVVFFFYFKDILVDMQFHQVCIEHVIKPQPFISHSHFAY